MATSFEHIIFFRSINGIGLGVVLPLINSLNADTFPNRILGKSFGVLRITGALGGTAGAFFGTAIAASSPMGIPGWRFAFYVLAIMSLITGTITLYYGHDHMKDAAARKKTSTERIECSAVTAELGAVLKVPLFSTAARSMRR